ncbi:CGNR zinc finger domain-containing protein [Amycolatopsis sp. lyj-108]|uniref:CGNR zinc finger domain-containing protein n=1 Tax=Amycolatopsis sp. lyj-108 TaxID=2789286 RepID=UPI00397DD885
MTTGAARTLGGVNTDASLVVEFLNTVNVERGTDLLDDLESWQRWARDHRLRADTPAAARETRDALRAAIGDPRLPRLGLRAPAEIILGQEGPLLVAETVTEAVMAASTRLTVLGEWIRLKICPADDCLWAFYDESRNRSRTWCSMRACGNREKARAWRARTADVST